MAYRKLWVDPEILVEYRGLTVYHCYVDNDIDGTRMADTYLLYPRNRPRPDPEDGTECHWFRLTSFMGAEEITEYYGDVLYHRDKVMQLIDENVLPPGDWLASVGWNFRLKQKPKTPGGR